MNAIHSFKKSVKSDKKKVVSTRSSDSGKKTKSPEAAGKTNTSSQKNRANRVSTLLKKSRLLFDHSPVAVTLLSLPEATWIDANHAFFKITGYARKEIIGKAEDKLHIFADTGEMGNVLEKIRRKGFLQEHDVRIRHKDGRILAARFSAEKIKISEGSYVLGTFVDMTSQKLAEKAERKNEEKYRTILETTEEGYYEIDLAGNFTFFNEPVCKLLGYPKKELMGLNNRAYTDKETARKVFQAFNKVYRTGEPTKEFDWQIIRKDGSRRYIEQSAALIKDTSGKPMGFRGIFHDITERKQIEQLLKQSEEKYRLLADHVKDLVWLMDMDLKITYISPSVEKITGYTLDDLKKSPLHKSLTTQSFQEAMNIYSEEFPRIVANPWYLMNNLIEMELIRKNGKILWVECAFTVIRDEDGNPLSILGEGRDITERKSMKYSLRKSEENFRHSLDDSPLGVRIVTAEGETLYANKAILDIYGYDNVDELKHTPLQKRYTSESYADFKLRQEKRSRGETGPSEYEISIVRKDGDVRFIQALRKEIFWNGEKQYQIIYQDVTERRKAEEKLKKTMNSLRKSIKTTIQVLGVASEARDPYTAGHQRRVADLARAIATEMKLSQDIIEGIRMTGAIHDIGKISIPSEILCKPTVLSDLEFSLVKAHCQHSYDIIKDVESPWPLADIVYQHHERMDGSGYPKGLKQKDILIEARILAVADVVEAMMSYRPYRPALGLKLALAEIEEHAGTLYDRDVANACLKLFREKNFTIE